MKKANIIILVILIIVIILVGGYFGVKYYLNTSAGSGYLFLHPSLEKVFFVSPVCSTTCLPQGVCGKDGKNYCNQCTAFQHLAGYAHDGPCKISYKNTDYGFGMTFPATWKGFIVQINTWTGHVINNYKQTYTGPLVLFKNPQTTLQQKYQDIPVMIFTHEQWTLVSGNNPTVAVSAAPIGPAEIGENTKYVFATPPRWYGFTDAIGFEEAVNIVKTFKAF